MLSAPADNNSQQLATARVRASPVPIPDVESWSPNGVQSPKKPFGASTGVQNASR